jgi:hypothetical protein
MLIQITNPNGLQKFIIVLTSVHCRILFQVQLATVDNRTL